MTTQVKAPLQRQRAVAPSPRKPKRITSPTKTVAQPVGWTGNQSRLNQLAGPAPNALQESRIAPRNEPNLFLPKQPGESGIVTPASHLPGLRDSIGTLSRVKPNEVLPPEVSHHPDTAKNKDTILTFGSRANILLAVAMEENNTISSNYTFGDIYPESDLRVPEPNPHQAVRDITSDHLSLSKPKIETRSFQRDELPGGPKTGDAANFGLYKMNWLMIRQTPTGESLIEREQRILAKEIRRNGEEFAPTDWSVEAAVGRLINSSTALATRIMVEAMDKWHAENPPDPKHPTPGNFWAGHRAGSTGLNDPGSADWNDILDYYLAVMAIRARLDNDKEGTLTNGPLRIGVNVINR
ncbi:MAG: hypothetical protein WCA10_07510 [Terracidiphilus sp.]